MNSRGSKFGTSMAVILSAVVCASLGAATRLRGQSREATEYEVKAAFLYNFGKFVEWPADASWKADDPLTICVVGQDPFGAVLDNTVRGKSINMHALAIRRIKRTDSWKGCQIAFVSAAEQKNLDAFVNSSRSLGVLTVGEVSGFANQGGIINFVMEEDKVRFEVNVEAADRAGLKISSKLLNLARIVRTSGTKGGG